MSDERPPATQRAAALGGALHGAIAAAGDAAATDVTHAGMAAFRAVANSLQNVAPATSKGNLYEYIEASRFNADAARQGSTLVAKVTAAHGAPTAPADIVIERGGQVIKEVQAKVSVSYPRAAGMQAQDKYAGMDRLVPKDTVDQTHDYTARKAAGLARRGHEDADIWADSRDHLTGELHADDVSSGGTTLAEADAAAHNARAFALKEELTAVGREAAVTGAQAAAAGALMGGAMSALRNGWGVRSGAISGGQAARNVATDTATAAARAGATGATSAVVRNVGLRAGATQLARANVATAVASGLIQSGGVVLAYARGDISGKACAEQLGETNCSTVSGLYVGAATGAIFGPVGAVVGSIAGFVLASNVYTSCIAILRDARLSTEASARVVALCDAAIRAINAERIEFERRLADALGARDAAFSAHLATIDTCLQSAQPESSVLALTELTALVGNRVVFPRFAEFDADMMGGRALVL